MARSKHNFSVSSKISSKHPFKYLKIFITFIIIGIIATIAIVSYVNIQQQKATLSSIKSDLVSASDAFKLYKLEHGTYPIANDCSDKPIANSICLKSSSGNSFTILKASNTVPPSFCIAARNDDIKYYITEDSTPKTDACIFPFASTLTATTASPSSINLSWDAVNDATSYELQVSSDNSFTNPTTIATQSGTTFKAEGLSSNTIYYYRVNATIIDDSSEWSSTASAVTTINIPSAPTVTAETVADITIWSWDAPSCVAGTTVRFQYRYTIMPSGYDYGWVAFSNSVALSVAFATSVEDQTYTVEVQAQCYVGSATSDWSTSGSDSYYRPLTIVMPSELTSTSISDSNTDTDTNTNTTPTITQPNAPSAPTVIANTVTTTTTWSWDAPSCATGTTARYQYKYTIDIPIYDSGWVAIASSPVGFTTVDEGYTYNLEVQAQCYLGSVTSNWGSSGNDDYYRPMTVPALTATTASSTAIDLSWTAITGATGYTLQQDTDPSFATVITIVDAQLVTDFSSTGLSSGITYYYRVNKTSAGGTSEWSVTDENTSATTTIDAPSAPTVTANTVTNTTTWSWDAPSCATGTTARYQYDYFIDSVSQAPSGWKTPTVPTATSIAFTTSTGGQTYTVQVQAQCYNTNTTSGWSTTEQASYYRPITLTAIAAITGTTTVGSVLTAGALTPSGATVTYQWQSATTSGGTYTDIPSATASTYTLVIGDLGKYIKVVATATGNYSGTQTSAASTVVSQAATADLTDLALSGSPTNYTFDGGTYDYTGITVDNAISSITVTPTGSGTITVDGTEVISGQASGPIALTAEVEQTITVIATETGNSAKTYTIKVTRNNSAQATPTFDPTAGVIAFGTTVTITSDGADNIYYTIDESTPTTSSTNQATTPLVINADVIVKALAVKAGWDDSDIGSAFYIQAATADLTDLALSGSPTNYTFDGGTYDYTGITVDNAISSITVTPTGSGTITVDGTEVISGQASGPIALTAEVEQTITVIATETGKSAKTYTINITRDAFGIGSSYQGGIVAYILQPEDPGYIEGQTRGLIAAPSDQSMSAEWGCYDTETAISGADGTAIGTGNQNTIDIMAGCATDGIAARLAGDLELNGYSDWYLPSQDELNKLYLNQVAIGGFADGYYWSSSEDDAYSYCAWYQYLSSGSITWGDKTLPLYVRAVRTFKVTSNAGLQATPTFNPTAGAIAFGTTVTITSDGADNIYYTIDGSTPMTSSTNQATTPLVINAAVTVKALAVKAGWDDSDIGSAAYTQAFGIGSSFQGGIVAYILQPGDPGYIEGQTHGLIAAQSEDDEYAEWGCYGTEISGADGTAIGTGNQNTIDIMAGCSTAGIAARFAGDLELNGYSDWYLPSQDELNQLYINRVAIGGFYDSYYWSSSEYENNNPEYAWGRYFYIDYQIEEQKDYPNYARAIRAF